jgi:hypothetical protein
MQKLALMMAVMILGMSPAHGCSVGTDLGNPGIQGPAEVMSLLPTWFSSGGKTLMAKDTISLAAAGGNRPAEPGGHRVGQTWPQTRWKTEGMESMEEAPGEWKDGLDPRDKNQVYRLENEAAPKAAEALRRGADAARGRGQRKSRWYQRMGARN